MPEGHTKPLPIVAKLELGDGEVLPDTGAFGAESVGEPLQSVQNGTRGSTFMGLVPRVLETFPGIVIRCFALVRTISSGEIENILDPIEGSISFNGVDLHRYP